jgi:hypothetical protein
MAVHGVSRSTRDLDLFTVFADTLEPQTWQVLRHAGVEVRIERGDSQDPLAGVVRLSVPREHPIDVIVGRSSWQAQIVQRSRLAAIEGVDVPVASAADLILLKLYAGGPQDAWDIEQLIAGPGGATLIAEAEARLEALPAECRRLWERIRGSEPPTT